MVRVQQRYRQILTLDDLEGQKSRSHRQEQPGPFVPKSLAFLFVIRALSDNSGMQKTKIRLDEPSIWVRLWLTIHTPFHGGLCVVLSSNCGWNVIIVSYVLSWLSFLCGSIWRPNKWIFRQMQCLKFLQRAAKLALQAQYMLRHIRPSVCLSIRHIPVLRQNEVMQWDAVFIR